MSLALPLRLKPWIGVRLVHVFAIQVGKPSFDITHGNKDRNFVAWFPRQNPLLFTSLVHLFQPLLHAVLIAINHRYENATTFTHGVQIFRIGIPHKLLASPFVGSRHDIYRTVFVPFFEKSADKRFVLFIFAEDSDSNSRATHGASPWA